MSFILTVKERSSEHEIINNILFAYVIIVIVITNKAHVENSTDIEIEGTICADVDGASTLLH